MSFLRAYLLFRLPSDDLEVTLYRDLESVKQAWLDRGYPEASAALHVGFWRPETEDFLKALKEHPGRVLVSASTVHALPPSFRSSSAPVGSAGSVPLHLGLTGWGYEVEDSTSTEAISALRIQAISKMPREIPEVQCEWLRELSRNNMAMFKEALNEGVIDDETYLAKENSLPPSLRNSLGDARFRWRCPIPPTVENIIDHIASTPPWFQSLPIEILSLSTRPANIMSTKSIQLIGDFRRYKADEVFAFRNMGRGSFNEIGARLLALLSGGFTSPVVRSYLNNKQPQITNRAGECIDNPPTVNATTFAEALEVALGLLKKDRDRRLMEMRMGTDGDPMTLQQIGEAMGKVRERIRQIENRCVERMKVLPFWNGVLGPKIRRILEERDDYLPPHGLEVIDPALKGAAKSINTLEYILERFVEPELHIVKESGLCFVTEIEQQEWLDAVRAARKFLDTLADERVTVDAARNMVDGLLVGRGRELREELWHAAEKCAHFADGKLVAYGYGAEHIVLTVLESSERPMHYSEILRVTQEKGYDYDLGRVHSAAAKVGLLYGRGTFGTMRHFPLKEAETRLVVSETEDLIELEGATRQWHAREICDRLEERGIDCGGNLTHYVASIALARSKHLTYLGRMVWASKASGAKGVANRLDMHQAVVSILIENEKPMMSDEIKDRLAAERGVNCFFQIQPEGPLVRVAAGVWGLMERDIPFSKEESRRVIDALRTALVAKRKGIHSSELIDEIAGIEPIVRRVVDPILLFGLAQKFEGFSVSKGQLLYLSEWGEPRRMNMSGAILRVLEAAGRNGVTIQEGMARVSELLERPFPPNLLFGQMSFHLGAVYDEASKRWRLQSEEESLSESEEEEVA
jgi:hypothetical protein